MSNSTTIEFGVKLNTENVVKFLLRRGVGADESFQLAYTKVPEMIQRRNRILRKAFLQMIEEE